MTRFPRPLQMYFILLPLSLPSRLTFPDPDYTICCLLSCASRDDSSGPSPLSVLSASCWSLVDYRKSPFSISRAHKGPSPVPSRTGSCPLGCLAPLAAPVSPGYNTCFLSLASSYFHNHPSAQASQNWRALFVPNRCLMF